MTPTFDLNPEGCYVGRVWRPGTGPVIVHVRGDFVVDISNAPVLTMHDLLETDDIVQFVSSIEGEEICDTATLEANSDLAGENLDVPHSLAPCDLQAIKASGVTFVRSMLERVIEERASGDPERASEVRNQIGEMIGGALVDLVPGSERARSVKELLIKEGMWSQYLEVGIGPYAEIFTKAQPMSAVGWGAKVGLHPASKWNNPEPEVVLAINSRGETVGATLGNDVNLRDIEGRSALLLGKAKDNNASAAIGPFIRLLDNKFTMQTVGDCEVTLSISGDDGFTLEASSLMSEISRDPLDLVAQTIGDFHQYPDGLMLYLGTMFAPVQDRGSPGDGFTHKVGDVVSISTPAIGTLTNRVDLSTNCMPWSFGTAALMRSLAERGN
ncbi:MAG: fumarylacetoacetate hydrolase family protein [Pseudomonadota bacterium]